MQKKLEAMQEKRISLKKNKAKVNMDYVKELEKADNQVLQDDRFKMMFEDEEFKIDKTNEAYKLHKPTLPQNTTASDDEVEEQAP